MLSLANVVVCVGLAVGALYGHRVVSAVGRDLLIASQALATMSAIVFVGLFENRRKTGDALSQELSETLQLGWASSRYENEPKSARSYDSEVLLQARMSTRLYARYSELPLIPGRYGGALYVLLVAGLCIGSFAVW